MKKLVNCLLMVVFCFCLGVNASESPIGQIQDGFGGLFEKEFSDPEFAEAMPWLAITFSLVLEDQFGSGDDFWNWYREKNLYRPIEFSFDYFGDEADKVWEKTQTLIVGQDLSGFNFDNVNFVGWDFIGADFSGASLVGTKFFWCSFKDAKVTALMINTEFFEARFKGAEISFDEALNCLFRNCHFEGVLTPPGADAFSANNFVSCLGLNREVFEEGLRLRRKANFLPERSSEEEDLLEENELLIEVNNILIGEIDRLRQQLKNN